MEKVNAILEAMEKAGYKTSISISWGAEDVISCAENNEREELTPAEIYDVLTLLESKHDANIGVNWDNILYWIDDVIEKRK